MKLSHTGLVLPALTCLFQWVDGRVVDFTLDLTWEDRPVAGTMRKTILTNGQFPGPPLRVKQGDQVRILVNNAMPFQTTMHWHGIAQYGTPWSDGVPGLTQTLIEPGDSFLYEWEALDYGSYAYHSHTRAQIDDGQFGAIYVEPDESVPRPFHLISNRTADLRALLQAEKNTQPLIISDWRYFTAEQTLEIEEASGVQAYCANSVLLNGKGSILCPPQEHINELTRSGEKGVLGNQTMSDMGCMPPLAARLGFFPFDASKIPDGYYQGCKPSTGPTEVLHVDPQTQYVSYDLISLAGTSNLVFSIDEHPMIVYAIDGRYVEPLETKAINAFVGSRYSVMVKLDQPVGQYTLRAANKYANQIINGTGVMAYRGSTPAQFNTSQPYINEVGTAFDRNATDTVLDESKVIPFLPEPPALVPDQTVIVNVSLFNSSFRWVMGGANYPMSNEDITPPVLFNTSALPSENIVQTLNNTWVDLILNISTPGQPQHPIHKHSNKFYVIGQGNTPWTYSSVAEAMEYIPESFNLRNPQIRDTFQSPPSTASLGWLALRYHVVNPGPFFIHCHLSMHESGGLAMVLMDGVDKWPKLTPGHTLLPTVADTSIPHRPIRHNNVSTPFSNSTTGPYCNSTRPNWSTSTDTGPNPTQLYPTSLSTATGTAST
ncbi:L-ascorbate oxidase [Aspergillus heteromorphus CBS 117.55]|uniref:L-ascorbate oxidase n=1 Tax=Aspergillus heteromorphus CBS 117.55 TaxID=1448321 RepID=A0A317VF18_9EURO|nr:L-ascorbate oxidase [Aspergillus heteromorphus CBS 117.55]PWY72964.1 L-ascorbate oxidase [Aspergillus heteromorphus CBS 117.55]